MLGLAPFFVSGWRQCIVIKQKSGIRDSILFLFLGQTNAKILSVHIIYTLVPTNSHNKVTYYFFTQCFLNVSAYVHYFLFQLFWTLAHISHLNINYYISHQHLLIHFYFSVVNAMELMLNIMTQYTVTAWVTKTTS